MFRNLIKVALFFILMVGLASLFVSAAANNVPTSGLSDQTFGEAPDGLKPTECYQISIANLITGSGNVDGSRDNDLILASSGSDNIQGKNGDDCVVGAVVVGGQNQIDGGNGYNVCFGNVNDNFNKCNLIIVYTPGP